MSPPLEAVDRIEVQVLVDNVTDNLSTLPAGADITHEWAYLLREGLVTEISGDNTCCACHGLALVITVRTGGRRRAHGAVRRRPRRLRREAQRRTARDRLRPHRRDRPLTRPLGPRGRTPRRARPHPQRRPPPRNPLLRAPGHVSGAGVPAPGRPARPVQGDPRPGHARPGRRVGSELFRGAAHPGRALLRERRDPPRHVLRDRIRRPHVPFRRRGMGARPPDHG